MKPVLKLSLLSACAVVIACSPGANQGIAEIPGAHDLVVSGDLVFVTGTDRNELRAIDLSANPRDFVRAPNPLYPLSIPTVDRPVMLAKDTFWDAEGREQAGPYVYALSANAQAISVVGVSRDLLREIESITVADQTITAMAARGDGQGPSTLYIATWDGTAGRIFSISVPIPSVLQTEETKVGPLVEIGTSLCGVSVQALLVMPDSQLAYSFRSSGPEAPTCGARPTGGSSFLLDLDSLTTTALQFPFPVRKLYTNDELIPVENPATLETPAGSFIYGVMDEQSCSGRAECRGVLAVLARDNGELFAPIAPEARPCGVTAGAIACDATGFPMLPIEVGNALIMGATLAADAQVSNAVAVLANGAEVAQRSLNILTTSDGRIVFTHGDAFVPLDVDPSRATVNARLILDPTGTPQELPATEGVVPPEGAEFVFLADGAIQDGTITITYGGFLPGFIRFEAATAPGATELPITADPANRIEAGDIVRVVGPEGGARSDCDLGDVATVTATPAPAAMSLAVTALPAVPTGCLFVVRAGDTEGARPWVVTSSFEPFMGRIADPQGDTPERFAWPPLDDQWVFADPNPTWPYDLRYQAFRRHGNAMRESPVAGDLVAPAVEFDFVRPFGAQNPAPAGRVGYRHILEVDDHYASATVTVSVGLTQGYRTDLAGAVAYRREERRMFVTFPTGFTTGDVVLQFSVGRVAAGRTLEAEEDFR